MLTHIFSGDRLWRVRVPVPYNVIAPLLTQFRRDLLDLYAVSGKRGILVSLDDVLSLEQFEVIKSDKQWEVCESFDEILIVQLLLDDKIRNTQNMSAIGPAAPRNSVEF